MKDFALCILVALVFAQAGFIYGSWLAENNPKVPVMEVIK